MLPLHIALRLCVLALDVVFRIRPPNSKEAQSDHHRPIIQTLTSQCILFDPAPPAGSGAPAPGQRRSKDLPYKFDHVFGPDCSQQFVYEHTAARVIDKVIAGQNATVFAYGATGSGKTHTMVGDESHPGVMVQCVTDLFSAVAAASAAEGDEQGRGYEVALQYLEVYNETIRDLLIDNSPALSMQEDKHGTRVQGLTQKQDLKSASQVFQLLARGNARRSQCATDQNQQSSRSHAVLQILIKRFNVDAVAASSAAASSSSGAIVPPTELWTSKLSLIDLAGSERAAASKNKGSIQKEGANINKSLLALGNVINALAAQSRGEGKTPLGASRSIKGSLTGRPKTAQSNGAGARTARSASASRSRKIPSLPLASSASAAASFIPYRGSKLTRLLKDSLSASSCTIMIAALSPSSLSREDSHNTLKYADRAKQIRVQQNAVVKMQAAVLSAAKNSAAASNNEEIRQLREQVAALTKEKENWTSSSSRRSKGSNRESGSSSAEGDATHARLLARVVTLMTEKLSIDRQISPLAARKTQLTLLQSVSRTVHSEYTKMLASSQGMYKHDSGVPALAELQQHETKLAAERRGVQMQITSLQQSLLAPWNEAMDKLRAEIDSSDALSAAQRKVLQLEIENRTQDATIKERDDVISSYSDTASQLTSQVTGTSSALLKALHFVLLNSSASGSSAFLQPNTQPTHAAFVGGMARAVDEGLLSIARDWSMSMEDDEEAELFQPFIVQASQAAAQFAAVSTPSRFRAASALQRGLTPAKPAAPIAMSDEADEEACPEPAYPAASPARLPSRQHNSVSSLNSLPTGFPVALNSLLQSMPVAAFAPRSPGSAAPLAHTPMRRNRSAAPQRPAAIEITLTGATADAAMLSPTSPPSPALHMHASPAPIVRNKQLLNLPTQAASQQRATPTKPPIVRQFTIGPPKPALSTSPLQLPLASIPVEPFPTASSLLEGASPIEPVVPNAKKLRSLPTVARSVPVAPAADLNTSTSSTGGRVDQEQIDRWDHDLKSLEEQQLTVAKPVAPSAHQLGALRGHKRLSSGQEKLAAAPTLSSSASMPVLLSTASVASSMSTMKALGAKAKLLGVPSAGAGHVRTASGVLPLLQPAPSTTTAGHSRSASAMAGIQAALSQNVSASSGLLRKPPPMPKPVTSSTSPKVRSLSSAVSLAPLSLSSRAVPTSMDECSENAEDVFSPSAASMRHSNVNRPTTAPLNSRDVASLVRSQNNAAPAPAAPVVSGKAKLQGQAPLSDLLSVSRVSPAHKKTNSVILGARPLSAQAQSPMRRA